MNPRCAPRDSQAPSFFFFFFFRAACGAWGSGGGTSMRRAALARSDAAPSGWFRTHAWGLVEHRFA